MESLQAQKLINKIQQEVLKNGIVKDSLIAMFKELRPFAMAEEDPSLTKVIRLVYEHLDSEGTFNIPIPEEPVDEDEEVEVDEEGNPIELPAPEPMDMDDFEAKRESLNYLLSIMKDARNENNRVDLIGYRDLLMAYD